MPSSLVVKINFSKKEHLTEKIYKSIKRDIASYLKANEFDNDVKKIFMNFDIK